MMEHEEMPGKVERMIIMDTGFRWGKVVERVCNSVNDACEKGYRIEQVDLFPGIFRILILISMVKGDVPTCEHEEE